MNYFAKVCSRLSDALLPDLCAICSSSAAPRRTVCPHCEESLPRPSIHRCPRCGNRSAAGLVCGRCIAAPPAFTNVTSPFQFAPPVDEFIHRLKYGHELRFARWFGDAIADTLGAEACASAQAKRYSVIVPMPLHPRRLIARGFNQSLEIARQVAKRTGIPISSASASRIIDTASQTSLDRDARRRNLKGAFECHRDLSGLRVLVIDDVVTTGSSANELSAILMIHGAMDVGIACAARTEHD